MLYVVVMGCGLCVPVTYQCGRHTADHPESQEFGKGPVTQQDEPGSHSQPSLQLLPIDLTFHRPSLSVS